MSRLVWMLVAGCWSGPPARVAPVPVAIPTAETCVVRDRAVAEPIEALALTVAGERFATLTSDLEALELQVARDGTAKADVETDTVELAGDVDLATFGLRPRVQPTHDGWLEVRIGRVSETRGGTALLDVELPAGLEPRQVRVHRPCADLTSETGTYDDWTSAHVGIVGPAPLRRTYEGGVVAHVADGEQVLGQVIARKADRVRVRIEGPNAVTAWIAASATEPFGPGGGGRGYGVGAMPRLVTCPTARPIHVTTARGEVRVGTLKAGRGAVIKHQAQGRVELSLGDATTPPYLRDADLDGCSR